MIIPSIDIMNGKAVQLRQGKEKVLEEENILDLARKFGRYGEIAVIDLDSAMGKGDNFEVIKELCTIAECRVGGGIRSIEKAEKILKAGAEKIIIGTKASPKFLSKLPIDRLIVAVDSKGDKVVTEGWTKNTKEKTTDKIKELENYCSEFLFTDVNREGMMKGINRSRITEVINSSDNAFTIAGGITTVNEVNFIENLGANSQIGMALYTGELDINEAFINLLDFEKNNGLIPTIVQDVTDQVLMLAYSSEESLNIAFDKGLGTYYSRSRDALWTKGMTSGNTQKLLRVKYDCDKDTLLFRVKQKNVACHLGSYSCFGDKEFSLDQLYEIIHDRIKNPSPNSYTSKVTKDEELLKEKLKEEIDEVVNYYNHDNLVWEISDVTYFMLALMAKKGIKPQDVIDELWSRRK